MWHLIFSFGRYNEQLQEPRVRSRPWLSMQVNKRHAGDIAKCFPDNDRSIWSESMRDQIRVFFFSSFLVSSGKHCDRALIIEASDTVSHEIITSCTLRMLLTGRLRRCRRKVYGNSEKLREKRFRSSEDSRTRLLVTYFYMYMFASVYLVYRIYLCRRKP